MKLQSNPEVDMLTGYMAAMHRCLDGCNYVSWFSARRVEFDEDALAVQALDSLAYSGGTPSLQLQNLIRLAYPESKPDLSTMCESSRNLMMGKMNKFIAYINPDDGARSLTMQKKKSLITGFWLQVKECIDPDQSKVLEYTPAIGVDDELWDFVFWGFTFLIINLEEKHCLLLHCGASD